jgi:hypothetical protein
MKGYRTPSWFRMKGIERKRTFKDISGKHRPAKDSKVKAKRDGR